MDTGVSCFQDTNGYGGSDEEGPGSSGGKDVTRYSMTFAWRAVSRRPSVKRKGETELVKAANGRARPGNLTPAAGPGDPWLSSECTVHADLLVPGRK